MSKKLLSLLLALSMVFVLAACGGGKQESKDTVTVVFDTDGGSAVESQTIKKGSAVVKPATPKKEGYIFDKWMLGSSEYEFGTPVNENIVLKANWIDPNGGNNGGSNPGSSFSAKTLVELNVRKGPGTDYEVARVLPQGSTVEIYETKEAGGYTWNRIGENEWIADDGTWLEKISGGGSSGGGGGNTSSGANPSELYWVNNWYWVQEKCEGDPEWVVKPESLKDQVTFTSSDTSIATVNSQGIVYGVKPGNVTITIKCGSMSDTLPLEVRTSQPYISFDTDNIYFDYVPGKYPFKTLNISYHNGADSSSKVTWTSSNNDLASVSDAGLVTSWHVGHVTITATTAEGLTAKCEVHTYGTELYLCFGGERLKTYGVKMTNPFNINLMEDIYYEDVPFYSQFVTDQCTMTAEYSFVSFTAIDKYNGVITFNGPEMHADSVDITFYDTVNNIYSAKYNIIVKGL